MLANPTPSWRDLDPEQLPPFSYDTAQREMLPLLVQLSNATMVDVYELADWVRENADALRERLKHEGVSDTSHRDHVHEIFAWVRIAFKERSAKIRPLESM